MKTKEQIEGTDAENAYLNDFVKGKEEKRPRGRPRREASDSDKAETIEASLDDEKIEKLKEARQIMKENKPPVTINLGSLSDEDSITTEEAFAKVAMILAKSQNIKLMTELSDYQLNLCAMLYSIAEKTKNNMLETLLTNYLQLKVSNKRKGRGELLELAKQSRADRESRFTRLKQMLGGV